MTLTRRDIILGAAASIPAAALVAVGSDSQPSPESNLTDPAVPSRAVPTLDEVRAWELRYNARYRAEHRARNQALLQMFEDEPTPMRVDQVAAHVEGELEAALGLVQLDHEVIAKARGDGYEVGRAQAPADAPAYENFDEFMAWHAGWHQGYPRLVDPKMARGYRPPPQPYFCTVCGVAEGNVHDSSCSNQNPVNPAGTIVRRPIRHFSAFWESPA